MKFGKRLKYDSVVEWENKYLNYRELKGLIAEVIKQLHATSHSVRPHGSKKLTAILKKAKEASLKHEAEMKGESSPLLHHNPISIPVNDDDSPPDQNLVLFSRFAEELTKVNDFFMRKEHELQGYYARLTDAVTAVTSQSNASATKLKELKTAFTEFYRGLCMLENYVELNSEGFRKILKKHFKMTGLPSDEQMELFHSQQFFKSTSWKEMMSSTESLYAKVFQLNKTEKARNELFPSRLEDTTGANMFKLGISVGACIAFLCVIFFLFSHGTVDPNVNWSRFIAVIPVYRAVLIPIIAVWLWGCNVFVWTKKRINYIFIFGLDPRSSLDYRRIFKTAATLSAVWLLSFFLFVATVMGNMSVFNIRPEIYPLVLIVFNITLVLAPFRALHRRSRFLLFKTIYNVIISPFGDIHFLTLYVGDILCSLVKTIFDIEYTICYFATGDWLRDDSKKCNYVNSVALPVISALPYFWRMLQCLKRYRYNHHPSNLGNAGKYLVACTVVVVGGINGYQSYPGTWTPMRYVWLSAFVFATCYNYLWDIFMDWGLGKRSYHLLRRQLLYRPHTWVYYYLMFSNLIFRFGWTAYITPAQIQIGIEPEFFSTILAVVEIFRRFTWSIFRVEYEQVNNIGENRALTFASLNGVNESQTKSQDSDKPVTPVNALWTGKGPFDLIVDFLQRSRPHATVPE